MLALALSVLRRPETVLRPQFFNEDGQVFYIATYFDNVWNVVMRPYAGYLHLAPRVGAYVARAVPVADAPLVANAFALLITVAVASYAGSARMSRLVGDWRLRVVLGASVALVPASVETLGSLTYVQWYLAIWLVLFACSTPAPDRRWAALDVLLVATACFSGPFAVLFAPLIVVRLVGSRGIGRLAPAIGLVGSGVQALLFVGAQRLSAAHGIDGPGALLVVLYRGIVGSVLGPTISTLALPQPAWTLPVVAAAIGLAGLVAISMWAIPFESRWRLLWAAGAVVAGGILAQTSGTQALLADSFAGSRYFLVPGFVAMAVAVGALGRAGPRVRASTLVLAALLTIGTVFDFRLAPQPDLHWPTASACIGGADPCSVPVHYVEAWTIRWPGAGAPYSQPSTNGTGQGTSSP